MHPGYTKATVYSFLLLLIFQPAVAQNSRSDSLLNVLLQNVQQDTNKVRQLILLADELSKESNFQDATFLIEKAHGLAEELRFEKGVASALLYTGIIHYRNGDYSRATSPLYTSIGYYDKVKDLHGKALALHWLGITYYALGEYEKALGNLLQAYSIRESLQDKKGMSFTLLNIANIYKEQQEYGKALEYHFKSLELKKELNDELSLAHSYNNIANIYTTLKLYPQAMDYFDQALATFERQNFKLGIAFVMGNLGTVYEQQGHYTKALESLQESIRLLQEMGNDKALAEALNHMSNVKIHLQRYQEAEESLIQAQELAKHGGLQTELINNYLIFSRLDSARGKMASAFAWLKKYTTLKEEIFNANKSKQIAAMQAAFDAERKDRAIELLEKEKDFQRSQKIIQGIALLSVLLVLLLISFGLMYFLQQKNKANKALKEQKRQLEELNELKDRLFSIIAHDLRSPLHTLKGVLNLAGEGVPGEELAPMLGMIGQNTQYTIDLVDNLLTWSKDNLQGSTVQSETFDLREVVQENMRLLSQQAVNKGIHMLNTIQEEVPVYADSSMISVVVRNLISNAIKFTHGGGRIIISSNIDPKSNTVTLCVNDNGVGIPAEQQKKLFGTRNFSTRGTANEKGTGLGLILCREFAEKNNGQLYVESEEGKGSTFFLTLKRGFNIPRANPVEMNEESVAI